MNIPATLKYTKDHEWIKIEGNIATVGITEYAQGELGDIVYVDVEAVKTVSDLFMPLSGEVIEFNEELEDAPELVNSDPYEKGWMIKIEFSDSSQIDDLLDAAAYEVLIKE